MPLWITRQMIPLVFGISARAVDAQIARGAPIDKRYYGAKPLYSVLSLNEWIEDMPIDKP